MKLNEILNILPDSYIVGGAVRDTVMRITPNDYDITTSATPTEVASLSPSEITTKEQAIEFVNDHR